MCILFVYTNPHPTPGSYRLIIASNRDEYYARNAAEASKWSDNPYIISGLDLEPGREGGTWLGLTLREATVEQDVAVRVGALLNVTGEPRLSGSSGRGFIVTNYLKSNHISTYDYVNQLKLEKNKFNAFNFVGVEISKTQAKTIHYSNVTDLLEEYIDEQILAFGNSSPQHPLRKVIVGQDRFHHIVRSYGQVDQEKEFVCELLNLLKWDERHLPDSELERRAPQVFHSLSSVFVHIPMAGYGTRTHSIILLDWQGRLQYQEHTMRSPVQHDAPLWVQNKITAHF